MNFMTTYDIVRVAEDFMSKPLKKMLILLTGENLSLDYMI